MDRGRRSRSVQRRGHPEPDQRPERPEPRDRVHTRIIASATDPRPVSSPGASASGPAGSATDPAGDVRPGYIDITRMNAGAASGALALGLDLADTVPPGSPAVGQVAYVFYLDVDGDGAWDYTVTLGLLPGGGYQPSFVDRTSSKKLEGAAFPGTAQLEGQHVSLTVRLDAMGCPATIAVQGAATQTKGGVRAGDAVPDATDQWVMTQTGCPA